MTNKTFANMTEDERHATMPFNSRNLVQVNLPATSKDSTSGNGETVWVELTMEGKRLYDIDRSGYVTGILRNDSVFYPSLRYGTEVQVRLRGRRKPIVPFEGNLSGLEFNVQAQAYRDESLKVYPIQTFCQVRGLSEKEREEAKVPGALDKLQGVFHHPLATPKDIVDLRTQLEPNKECCADCYREIVSLSR